MPSDRVKPNILITGTPGTGKSRLSSRLAELTDLKHLDVNQVAERCGCYSGYDSDLQCRILDEDALEEAIKDDMNAGGQIVDYHGCDLFPEEWFDKVFVLRTDNTVLYDRLSARGYSGKKMENNISSEIFQVILEEARDHFEEEKICELRSDTEADFEENVKAVTGFIQNYKP